MKHITLIIGLLVVGCLTAEQKQKALRDSVVGEYEDTKGGDTAKLVFLENDVAEGYWNGKKKEGEAKWSIVDGKIYVNLPHGEITIWRINKDGSITVITGINKDEEREDYPKEDQFTYKRIK